MSGDYYRLKTTHSGLMKVFLILPIAKYFSHPAKTASISKQKGTVAKDLYKMNMND